LRLPSAVIGCSFFSKVIQEDMVGGYSAFAFGAVFMLILSWLT
jgi:hypothetical protein